ncbi:hypothetical protein DFH09DRAFT_128565 [Mycena vulgaris]|nr:hypothetical protein DFH09DRAFT_128565 [Mycena vulgaris]
MPPQLTPTEVRLDNLVKYLTVAVSTLRDLSDVLTTPFLKAISSTTTSLLISVQSIKRNKEECALFLDHIHTVLYAIIGLHVNLGNGGVLPPETLDHVGKFMETLQKIHIFFDSQQDGSAFKRFFRQIETKLLLKECQHGIQQAVDVFKIQIGTDVLHSVTAAQSHAQKVHEELVQLISTLDDDASSDQISSINGTFSNFRNSSTSFSLLPAEPKIFHGRDSELNEIVASLGRDSARIAILGTGGIGKTSLARAALHHPQISARFSQRLFVPCDSATSSSDLAALVASHLGLNAERDPTKSIVRYFLGVPSCLLVFDNFETPWEPLESRAAVEDFLSVLSDISHLALIITLRGAERPGKVAWTRPFLSPLNTLTDDAARQTFLDIADDVHEEEDIHKLLSLTGNLPLAIQLIAHLAEYEGCLQVLGRWETERTSLLSDGHDRRSNLELSIKVSLSSPRMMSYPNAKTLLSLLSLLPDGLSDTELTQSGLPIRDILTCKAALLQTSLAYIDRDSRLKALVPIREYMATVNPPARTLVHPLRQYFHTILQLFQKYHGKQLGQIVNQITSNLGNLQNIILDGLNINDPDIRDTFRCAMALNGFHRVAGRNGPIPVDHLSDIGEQLQDGELKARFITYLFLIWHRRPISDPQGLINEAQEYFSNVHEPAAECKFYNAIGPYFSDHEQNIPKALEYFKAALLLSNLSGDTDQQCVVLNRLAMVNNMIGAYPDAQLYAGQATLLARQSGNLYQESAATLIQTYIYMSLGDYKRSMDLSQRSRECMRLCGLTGSDVDFRILRCQAEIHSVKSEYKEMRKIYTEILEETSPEVSPANYGYSLLNIGAVDIIMGASEEDAKRSIDAAKSIFSAAGSAHAVTFCNMVLGDLKLREGDTSGAKVLLEQGFNSLRGYDAEAMLFSLERLGDVSRWSAHGVSSMEGWSVLFLGQALKLKNPLAIHQALGFLGDQALADGDDGTAHSLFNVALDGFTQMDVHISRGNCLLRLGDLALKQGDLQKAAEFWTSARPLFVRSSQGSCVEQIDRRLAVSFIGPELDQPAGSPEES